jgi:hypothetical protein
VFRNYLAAIDVYEAIIDDDRSRNAFGLMMSLNMLIETPGGFDYTGADCSAWMKEAGFSSTSVTPLVGPDSMVVGRKQLTPGVRLPVQGLPAEGRRPAMRRDERCGSCQAVTISTRSEHCPSRPSMVSRRAGSSIA